MTAVPNNPTQRMRLVFLTKYPALETPHVRLSARGFLSTFGLRPSEFCFRQLLKPALSLAFLLLCLANLAAAPAGPPPPVKDDFTFATYNINFNNRALSNVLENIRQTKADLVGLQETNPESEQFLRRALAREYPYQEYRDGLQPATGLAVLSRRPFPPVKHLPPQHGRYGALLVDISFLTRTVQVMVVHLQSPRLQNQLGPMGALRAISEMEEIHAFEIAARWRQMATNRPTIILGDFNSLSAGNAPRFLRDRGFLDSLAVVNPQPDSQHTWHERTMGNDWSLRIDYLFHSPHLTTLESQVIAKPGSDHYPMVSRLRWKAPAKP